MTGVRARLGSLRATGLPILQCAVAASLAWLVATRVVGHTRPFFAPIAAIIALGVAVDGRGRRAVEVAGGVAVGVLVGDLLIAAIGTGTWQLGVIVALAMGTAVVLGGGGLVIVQAGSSAVLISTLSPAAAGSITGARFVDALVGGALGILVHAVVPAVDPVATVHRALAPLVRETVGVLEDLARALRNRDREGSEAALLRARGLSEAAGRFATALDVAVDTTRSVPPRWGARGRVAELAAAGPQIDLAVRDLRVLARGVVRAVDLGSHVPEEVPAALGHLAAGVGHLGEGLDEGGDVERARREIIRAAGLATLALENTQNMSVSVIVAQVRSTAVDLLRAVGADRDSALEAVRSAADELRDAQAGAPA
jgi:uncharacterized membrane protein YgaE (UPF0421/DUF939 family)